MVTVFEMKSSYPSSKLSFSNFSQDYFDVTLETPSLKATKRVFVYHYRSSNGFVEFFEELASGQCPWEGTRSWETLEGELTLSAKCSALGTVVLQVVLLNETAEQDSWSVTCTMYFDSGALSEFARQARMFMNH